MEQIEGQMTIFDLEYKEPPRIPILLEPWQSVYIVKKGDVLEAKVVGEEKSWLCGADDRGYRLVFQSGGYGCTWNSHIGIDCFFQKELALEQAEQYLNTHDVILANGINPINTVAYQYVRDSDSRQMTAFYSELENGMYYIKEFITYHHIADKKAIKKFMKQQEFKYCNPERVDIMPIFKNMYKCKNSDWIYAESGYGNAVG